MEDSERKKLTTRVNTRRGNCRVITISDNVPEHWEDLIFIAKSSYDFYAYIFHDKDVDENGELIPKHLHLLCIDKGGTTFKRHCERFSSVIAANFIEKGTSPRALARYLTHKDSPKKFQYSYDDIVCNQPDRLASFYRDTSSDAWSEYLDYCKLLNGTFPIEDYFKKYAADFAGMPFYQKHSLFHRIATSHVLPNQPSPPCG